LRSLRNEVGLHVIEIFRPKAARSTKTKRPGDFSLTFPKSDPRRCQYIRGHRKIEC
jgi:hypothetical protein